jgi:negative regulator of sigma-B (phosphoserine phosphatase)
VDATAVIDWGVAGSPLAGEAESGDLHLVKPIPTGVLVAVVDGLGHGAEAAMAARTAVATLDQHARESVLALVQRCHHALGRTRGAVMSLAHFDYRAGIMTWLGVGNVEGVLLHADGSERPARASLLTRGGIVGQEVPPLRAVTVPVFAGDTLLLASDGIKRGFADDLPVDASPQQWADRILASHRKGTDDALVLVARYLGGGP